MSGEPRLRHEPALGSRPPNSTSLERGFTSLNDVFLLNLALEATQSIFKTFAFLNANFCQTNLEQTRSMGSPLPVKNTTPLWRGQNGKHRVMTQSVCVSVNHKW